MPNLPGWNPKTLSPLWDPTTGLPKAGCCCGAPSPCLCKSYTAVKFSFSLGSLSPDFGRCLGNDTQIDSPNITTTSVTVPRTPGNCGVEASVQVGTVTIRSCANPGSFSIEPVSVFVRFVDAAGVVSYSIGINGPPFPVFSGGSPLAPFDGEGFIGCCKSKFTFKGATFTTTVGSSTVTFGGGQGTVELQGWTKNECCQCCQTLRVVGWPTGILRPLGLLLNMHRPCEWSASAPELGNGQTFLLHRVGSRWRFVVTEVIVGQIYRAVYYADASGTCTPENTTFFQQSFSNLQGLWPKTVQFACKEPTCPTDPNLLCCRTLLASFGTGTHVCFSQPTVQFTRSPAEIFVWRNTANHARLFCDNGKLIVEIDVSSSICGNCPSECLIRYETDDWDGVCPESAVDDSFLIVRDDLGGAPPLTSLRCANQCTSNCDVCCIRYRFNFAGGSYGGHYIGFDNRAAAGAACDWVESEDDFNPIFGIVVEEATLTCANGAYTLHLKLNTEGPINLTAAADANGCVPTDPSEWSTDGGVSISSVTTFGCP